MERLPDNQNKRESGISRVVGVEESLEQELLSFFERKFEKDQKSDLDQEHAPELEAIILEINEKMKEFMAKYDIQSLEIPGRNIHMVDKSKLSPQLLENLEKRYEKIGGIYLPYKQQIVVFKDYVPDSKIHFIQILVHEIIHANSFASIQKVEKGGTELTKKDKSIRMGVRRMGFEVDSAKTGNKLFYNINEAITTELTMRFDNKYFSQFEDLRQEYEERKEAIEAVAIRSGKGEQDLGWVIANLEHRKTEDSDEMVLRPYSYNKEREELTRLIDDLYEKNKDEFQSSEDVFTLFAKAALDGRLLPVARLIEKTYGKGSFRELAEKTAK